MRREEQERINEEVDIMFNFALSELPDIAHSYLNDKQLKDAGAKRLCSCTAWVWETQHFYVLQSYNTFIACIDKNTNICYDALRVVYGYTSTSAQHISKFKKSKVYGGYGCDDYWNMEVLTARDI